MRTHRAFILATSILLVAACSREPAPRPAETFSWVRQSISLEPPPATWRREGENSGGMLGIRFILIGGVGEVIGVSTYPWLAKRDRREAISELLAKRDSLARSEFLHKLSLARYPSPDEPLSERETISARAVDAALDATQEDYLADRTTFVASDLMTALRAASTFEPTQAEVLPRIRLRPERMQEPERWRIGYERDTTLAGYAAFASDDTLITPERPLAYREIYWVVNGCAFKASYQGLEKNAPAFNRLVGSITFPESTDVAAR